ncbi:MAG: isoleucine--tRNA ligase [Candidatus Latescibacteria bacterium]|nr:isoleucine--tRNA ligase [Candidatus Latescibacterota bacterium]
MVSEPGKKKNVFEPVPSKPDFPKLERDIIKFWELDGTFMESVRFRQADNNDYVFYDGPPFANGLPHYGHVLTGYVKDVVPRYKTMRGYHVSRRFGWDCHGLPAEMEMEKTAGIHGRDQILGYGMDRFNEGCRSLVLKYVDEWERVVTRQGRWVDFKNDYKTMDIDFMESVLWAFKTLYDKELIYEGARVLAYCSRCETPLSNFETRIDNSTRPKQDPAITVLFRLNDSDRLPHNTNLLVWTTTPWTLPSNLGIAVGSKIDYILFREGDTHFIIARERVEAYQKQLQNTEKVKSLKGSELVGLSYIPLFDYFADTPNAFKILAGDFVTTEDGTGIVHMAPGFGEDDQKLCDAHGIPTITPVDYQGMFDDRVPDYQGVNVFDANKDITKRLREEGKLVRHDTIEHNYPFCWRCDTPLIYRAFPSWYVKVTAIKDRMLEHNREINWIPEHIRDGQFGRWIAEARDWSISRNRYWGTPLPIWECDNRKCNHRDVYGSIADMEHDFGKKITDLHRPYIDELTRECPDCGGTLKRIEDVLDCWFESGSMPYAQVHYPFENKDWFENNFPADFIVEYIAQTRGWFYTLTVLATGLFDKPSFLNSICHGVVLDENGQKLSKRLRNYPPLDDVMESVGSDTLRWFLMSNTILKGGNLQLDSEGKAIFQSQKAAIAPLWNSYYFLVLYANIDGYKPVLRSDSGNEMDVYIISKLSETLERVTRAMDIYDIPGTCEYIGEFMEILTNWYIRRNRRRFWKSESDSDKKDAYDTLYTVMVIACRMAAPLLPFTTESIYRNLTGERSIHLSDWPTQDELRADVDILRRMDAVRRVCSLGHGVRHQSRIRVRQPLTEAIIAGKDAHLSEHYTDIIMDELNVKAVRFTDDVGEMGRQEISVDARTLGPRLGKKMKDVLSAVRSGNVEIRDDGYLIASGEVVMPEEFELRIIAEEGHACMSDGGLFTCLDLHVDRGLELEGLARDVIRMVQNARREADLVPDDRITLGLLVNGDLKEAIETHKELIQTETLAKELCLDKIADPLYTGNVEIQGNNMVILVGKI